MTASEDLVLFALFPYAAVVTAVVVGVIRFRLNRFSYSSLSSQFLESRRLFWGSVPFHYGILVVLAGHLIGFLFPRSVAAFNSVPLRLFILEATGLAFGLLTLFGLIVLVHRRITTPRVRAVTSRMDVVLLVLLLSQVVTGIYTAVFYRWGSAWYVHTATPYLWSLLKLAPETQYMAALPVVVKLHVLNAFALVAVIPFTRLVHLLVVPITYLWRPYQLVVWHRRLPVSRRTIAG
ncbi:MAG: respiratory nitrate reductase subunit gamma [Gemmatimonadales bacterium]